MSIAKTPRVDKRVRDAALNFAGDEFMVHPLAITSLSRRPNEVRARRCAAVALWDLGYSQIAAGEALGLDRATVHAALKQADAYPNGSPEQLRRRAAHEHVRKVAVEAGVVAPQPEGA